SFGLLIGRAIFVPANDILTRAFRSAKITVTEDGPSGFSMTFQAARDQILGVDYELFLLPYLQPFNRVGLFVNLFGVPYMLIDGLITKQEFVPGKNANPDTILITGMDVSAAMNMTEESVGWPLMADFLIVEAILAKYAVPYGVLPVCIPTAFSATNFVPGQTVQQQTSTDYSYIRHLAARNGYIFRTIPGPTPGVNTAYFGPPNRLGVPSPTMNVGTLPDGNVESIRFAYDGMKPTLGYGAVLDTADETDVPVPVATFLSTRLPPFVSQPAVIVNEPYVRKNLLRDSRLDPIQAEAMLQGMTNRSCDEVVVATGSIDVDRYRAILVSPGLVNVRGAGLAHDGTYYVKEVTHNVDLKGYTQDFVLTREGLGSLTPLVPP
ncbi:MAG: hypothetical protein HN348_24135, partial [Proteobacteria bacterium]|nr:hypothetical protein [Pseudomonadota bacterium]